MPVVPLQCPLCAGLIQIDTALAGQQVGCPHCQGVMALPPADVWAAMLAPPVAPQLPTGELLGLACPFCSGPFQVPQVMAGQQVGCPHCGSPVLVPPLGGSAPPIESVAAAPPDLGSLDAQSLLPPGIDVQPTAAVASVKSAVATHEEVSARNERLPPGTLARKSAAAPQPQEPAKTRPASDRLPPSAKPTLPSIEPRPAPTAALAPRTPVSDRLPPGPAPRPAESPPDPPLPSAASEPLPSAASESHPPIESLLPPGAEVALPPPAAEVASARPARLINALLPPGVSVNDAAPAMPGPQVPIPAAPQRGPLAATLPPGTVAVPTSDGGFVTIKESPKTIGAGEDEMEVRRLSSAEKSARRFRRNLILCGICLAILFGVLVAMMRQ